MIPTECRKKYSSLKDNQKSIVKTYDEISVFICFVNDPRLDKSSVFQYLKLNAENPNISKEVDWCVLQYNQKLALRRLILLILKPITRSFLPRNVIYLVLELLDKDRNLRTGAVFSFQ